MNNVHYINENYQETDIIYEKINHAKDGNIIVSKIDIKNTQTNKKIPKHWHKSIEILVPAEGKTIAWIEGNSYEIKPEEYLIINSNMIHSCWSPEGEKKYVGYAILINLDLLEELYPNYEALMFIPDKQDIQIKTIIDSIIDNYENESPTKNIKAISYAYSLLSKLIECQKSEQELSYNKTSTKLVNILNYINHHYNEDIPVQQLADMFYMSYGHLASLFKKTLSITVKEYISYIRIQHIEKDLLTSDQSIEEIYQKHGFTNKKSFYREFKKYHDISPVKYRNSRQ